jgi:hypothetical protein
VARKLLTIQEDGKVMMKKRRVGYYPFKKGAGKMKSRFFIFALLIVVLMGCDLGTGNNTDNNDDNSIITNPIDPAFWFKEIYDELILRVGNIKVNNEGIFLDDTTGVNMGQMANKQYVCNAINAKKGSNIQPIAGTATQVANCEYLLKMIDNANSGSTSYGTSSYATKQVIDKVAVNNVMRLVLLGKFVAVASSSNKVTYSTDGINWIAATLPSSTTWRNVTFGNGKFVAVNGERYSSGNAAAYSTNGINWTAATLPSSGEWYVTYGNGKFVAINGGSRTNLDGSNKAAYSTNGINWTAATLPSNMSAWWYSIAYGNGKFVAGGIYVLKSSTILTSLFISYPFNYYPANMVIIAG